MSEHRTISLVEDQTSTPLSFRPDIEPSFATHFRGWLRLCPLACDPPDNCLRFATIFDLARGSKHRSVPSSRETTDHSTPSKRTGILKNDIDHGQSVKSKDIPRVRILVVDDEPSVRKVLAHSLGQRKFSVLTAPDLRSAVDAACAQQPDVVLLDVKLGPEDGLQLVNLLRNAGLAIPIVVLTGHAGPHDGFTARDLGVAALIEKPSSPDAIAKALVDAVSNARRAAIVPADSLRPGVQVARTTNLHGDNDRLAHVLRMLGDPKLSVTQFDELLRAALHLNSSSRDEVGSRAPAVDSRVITELPVIVETCLALILAEAAPSRQQIAVKLGVSPRQLGATLTGSTGWGFRHWCRVARFQRMLRRLLDPTVRTRVSEAAYGAGYEHARVAVRDAHAFLKLTPTQIVRMTRGVSDAQRLRPF